MCFACMQAQNGVDSPMAAKWSDNTLGDANSIGLLAEKFASEYVVLLMYGKNSFGDKIYSYLKIMLPDLQRLKAAVQAGKGFNPSDFGTVIAAGKGEPTDEVRREVASTYQVIDGNKQAPAPSAPIPTEKKAWDEY